MRPDRLNNATASLFIVGSACFVLGSVPAYADAVSDVADGLTFFAGSVFFTTASFLQLLQAQTPSMTDVEDGRQNIGVPVEMWRWLPHDRNWLAAITQFPGTLFFNVSTLVALFHSLSVQQQDRHVWRPDFFGSTLFLVASVCGILAVDSAGGRPRSLPWSIAWLNMTGSVLFMAAALAAYVLPGSGELLSVPVDVAGTLFGALCFLIAAALTIPAWKRAVHRRPAVRLAGPLPEPHEHH